MTVRSVLQRLAPFSPLTTGAEALACFAADTELFAAPVVDHDGAPIGLVSRGPLRLKLADKAGFDMFAQAPVTLVMDTSPLIVEASTPLRGLCDDVLIARPQAFHDGFIITEGGRYAGFGAGLGVLAAISKRNADVSERLRLAMNAARAAVWEIDFAGARLIGAETLDRQYGRRLAYDDVRRLGPDFVCPEDREATRRALVEIAAGAGRGRLRCRVQRADGRERWTEHAVEVFRGDDNEIQRIVLMTTDITERREMELKFDETIAELESALETKRAAIERFTSKLAADPVVETLPENLAVYATYEGAHETSARLVRISREIAIRDRALVEAVETAEAASQAKSRFLASMSHELRTPLNAIIGYSEILDEDLTDAKMLAAASDAQRIRGAARHLLHLINEILDLSKIEAGRMDVSSETFDVAAMAREAVETVRPMATKNMNEMVVDLAPDLGEARTDSIKVNQCLMNLLSNACKFTTAGAVTLTGRRTFVGGVDCLSFAITDSGIGMNEEQIAKLFQPFTQADASTTRNFGGTGLGLAITQRLARLLGGDVTVTSAPGEGATFTLLIPVHYGAPDPIEPCDQDDIEASAQDRPRVLVIDDDPVSRDLVRRALSRLGFAVADAANGQEGLAAARARRHALVILDIQLPDMSGWSVLETLKHDAAFEEAPVMILSIDDDRMRAMSMGACEHLVKPVDRDTLAAAAVRFARFDAAPALPAHRYPAQYVA